MFNQTLSGVAASAVVTLCSAALAGTISVPGDFPSIQEAINAAQTGDEIVALLRAIHDDGNTVVVVTHDPKIGEQAGRRLSIRDGRIDGDAS